MLKARWAEGVMWRMNVVMLIVRGRPRLMFGATGVVVVLAASLWAMLRFLVGISPGVSVLIAAGAAVLGLLAFVLLCTYVLLKILQIADTAEPVPAEAGAESVPTGSLPPGEGTAAASPDGGQASDGTEV
jgi:hypothetical protein